MGKSDLLQHVNTKIERIFIQKPEILMGKGIKQSQFALYKQGVRIGDGLIYLVIFNVIMIIVITFLSSGILRLVLVVPYLLFIPGYAIIVALFPRKGELSGLGRVVLSVGLSFVIVVLTGMFLNYTSFGIRLEPVMYFMFGVVVLTSAIAWLRRLKLEDDERFEIVINLSWLSLGKNTGGKALSLVLIIGIIGTLSFLGYLAASPKEGEAFSEFYILGQPGKSAGYIQNIAVGEEGRVYVGITNHENKDVLYTIKVFTDNIEIASLEPVLLENGKSWEGEVNFTTVAPGEDKKFEFLLYRDNEVNVYKSLHLWIDVSQ